MTGKQLRNSILQWAISGRLVPQDPADEPASQLLARISRDGACPVSSPTKRKSKPLPPISDEEKPFEIPDSWEWVRLQSVCELIEDCPHSTAKDEGEGYPLIRTPNVGWGRLNLNEVHRVSKEIYNQRNMRAVPQEKDLIFAREAPAGNIAVIQTGQQVCLGQRTVLVRPISKVVDSDYLAYYILSPVSQEALVGKSTGTTVAHVNLADFRPYVIALPPLAEQRRIVERIEELMPWVERYDKAQGELDRLNSQLKDKLKKSILQEAISGRLVPPTDEPASKLLARIRQCRDGACPVSSKGTKKSKPLPPIPDEEKPFEIPASWEWVRLGDVCSKIVDGDHNPPKGELHETEYLMLSSKNVNNNRLNDLGSVRYLSKSDYDFCNNRTNLKIGDVLLTTVATIGRSCVYEGGYNLAFQRSVSVITTHIYNYYLKFCLDSPYCQTFMNDNAKGTAQRGFYINQLEALVIPLPPLAEQHRIVEKIEQLFSELENL